MEPFVNLFQAASIDVCVDLRSRYVGMAKHFLNASQIGMAGEKLGRKRMPQRMRGGRSLGARPGDIFRNYAIYVFPR